MKRNKKIRNNDDFTEYEIVYSTNKDALKKKIYNDDEYNENIPPEKQTLYIYLDKKHRSGKIVTIIEGFVCRKEEIYELEKELKKICSCGGSVKDNAIIIQGNFKEKIKDHLKLKGYNIILK